MTDFYLVRHGQTEINIKHAFNGSGIDSPLTKKGREEAKQTGKKLAEVYFDQVVSSSLPRAVTTARLIAAENKYSPVIHTADGLREMAFGDWEGLTGDSLDMEEEVAAYFEAPLTFDSEVAKKIGAETYASVAHRTRAVIETIKAAQPAGRILLVAHGVVLLVLLHILAEEPLETLRRKKIPRNASISRVTTTPDGYYQLQYRDQLT